MLGATLSPRQFLDRVGDELRKLDPEPLARLADEIFVRYRDGGTVFVIGNGGSGSNATHFAADTGKNCLDRKYIDDEHVKRLRIVSLTDNVASLLAWANDEGFERIFVEQLKNLARPGDLLVAISGSGNSPNVLRAVEWANAHGVTTFGCTGYSGGKLRQIANHCLHVALDDMGVVESIHLTAFHWIVGDLYRRTCQAAEAAAV
jgi:D-sedoheptulose 7-phosphate isomerase